MNGELQRLSHDAVMLYFTVLFQLAWKDWGKP